MKNRLRYLFCVMLLTGAAVAKAGEFDADRYKRVTMREIAIDPAAYKSKRIKLDTRMVRVVINPPAYVEKEFSRKKYCYFIISGRAVPVIARIKEFQDILNTVKKGQKFTLFGKLREFRLKCHKRWRRKHCPRYYIEAEHIKLTGE